jgi:hypothetical protein
MIVRNCQIIVLGVFAVVVGAATAVFVWVVGPNKTRIGTVLVAMLGVVLMVLLAVGFHYGLCLCSGHTASMAPVSHRSDAMWSAVEVPHSVQGSIEGIVTESPTKVIARLSKKRCESCRFYIVSDLNYPELAEYTNVFIPFNMIGENSKLHQIIRNEGARNEFIALHSEHDYDFTYEAYGVLIDELGKQRRKWLYGKEYTLWTSLYGLLLWKKQFDYVQKDFRGILILAWTLWILVDDYLSNPNTHFYLIFTRQQDLDFAIEPLRRVRVIVQRVAPETLQEHA